MIDFYSSLPVSKLLSRRPVWIRIPLFGCLLAALVGSLACGLDEARAVGLSSQNAGTTGESAGSGWLGFRGGGTSASQSSAPAKLDTSADGNLAWQLAMPGGSVAGPIVIGGLVVTTSSSGQQGEVLHVTGVDLDSGHVRWEQTFRATGRPFCHPTSADAAPTPVSDGQRIFAFFSSNDLACLSLDGELLWYRGLGYDYPQAGNDVGMASSPLLVDNTVVLQVEAQGDSFAVGIDADSGQNLWRIPRPKSANWSSPLAIQRPGGRTEVVLQSGEDAIAVDPRSGELLWQTSEAGSSVPSPTPAGGLLLLPGDALVALDIGGDVATPPVVWRDNKLAPRNASVVAAGGRLFALKGSVLVAAQLADGRTLWQKRLPGLSGTWATPVFADGKLYVFDQAGLGLVVAAGDDAAETISQVDLGEEVLASPAIADGRLIVRGRNTLFCFE